MGRAVGRAHRLAMPLAWFPRLMGAGEAERAGWEALPGGIHWPTLDEDVSIDGLLEGRGDVRGVGRVA